MGKLLQINLVIDFEGILISSRFQHFECQLTTSTKKNTTKGMTYIETSAKNGENVDKAFNTLAIEIMRIKEGRLPGGQKPAT